MTQPFDMSLVQRGARNRRTPYFEATQRYGPKGYTVYNHMYFPIRFDSFEAEFDALLNGVTLWDVAVERCLEISGSRRLPIRAAPHAARPLEVRGRPGKYVLICDSDGGIVNDPVLTRMDEQTFWFALASSDALLFARGLRNAYPDLDVTIREADVAPLQVQGPKSEGPDGQAPGSRDPRHEVLLLDGGEDRRTRRWWSRAPDGRPRSATRSTSRTRRRAPRSSRRSWRRARSSASSPRARATSAGSRARSSTGAPT